MNYDRKSIYNRLKIISQTHKATTANRAVNGFAVGREWMVNVSNMTKQDIQKDVLTDPKYFYSEKWNETGRDPNRICSDFPMMFVTAGEKRFKSDSERLSSVFQFDGALFDLMFYDERNGTGNKVSSRELEVIWCEAERMLIEILNAYQDNDINAVYNLIQAGQCLEFPENLSLWTPEQVEQAQQFIKCDLMKGNFTCRLIGSIIPFEYQHNERLAGVGFTFETDLYTGCVQGEFEKPECFI